MTTRSTCDMLNCAALRVISDFNIWEESVFSLPFTYKTISVIRILLLRFYLPAPAPMQCRALGFFKPHTYSWKTAYEFDGAFILVPLSLTKRRALAIFSFRGILLATISTNARTSSRPGCMQTAVTHTRFQDDDGSISNCSQKGRVWLVEHLSNFPFLQWWRNYHCCINYSIQDHIQIFWAYSIQEHIQIFWAFLASWLEHNFIVHPFFIESSGATYRGTT